ncbi:MAG TPA: nucleoside-diphosphate sugar epimerase/dehydratase [Campylobacterales bacterium]|nr:nucleoside-diphosphate sugar epimerase/dehydratase [Campylobacterales bacterium]
MSILTPTQTKRAVFFIFFDALLSFFSFYASYLLRFNFEIPPLFMENFFRVFAVLMALKLGAFFVFSGYKTPWRFFSVQNLVNLVRAHILAYTLFGVLFIVFADALNPFPRSVIFIDFIFSVFLLGALRISKRIYLESKATKESLCVIVGATNEGSLIASYLKSHDSDYYPAAFLEDDKHKIGGVIHGFPVVNLEGLGELAEKSEIDSALIAKTLTPKELTALIDSLSALGIPNIKKINFFEDHTDIKDISIEELLARAPKDLDTKAVARFIAGKTLLITGAGGSIGSEISRQCAKFGAQKLILVDNSEYSLYKISEELHERNIVSCLVSVTDKKRLARVFETHKPQIVIHAAAFKHVPLAEENIDEVVENNIFGTKNTLELALENNAEKFVLISTDKAVRPTNVMGATKRVCELIAQNIKQKYSGSGTEIAAVRFGNVIGSSGSVIPKFKEQIAAGGPVTVTHPDIERYFMLIDEACSLVLQAAAIAKGSEIFILDMGERVKIVDVAKKMLELTNKQNDVKIVFSGLRAGEKLIEELLTDDSAANTEYPSITVAKESKCNFEALQEQLWELKNSEDKLSILKKIIPEFDHQLNGKS